MKKRDVTTLIILGAIFLFIFIIIMLFTNKEEKIKEKTEYNKLTLVTEESTFLSITDSINKICELANQDISLSFIVKSDIDKNDYKNKIFKGEEIYVVSRLNLYKYYIKGVFYTDLMDSIPEYVSEGYFVLNYDINNSAYNIEIISEEQYNNASSEEYIFETINNNEYNRFKYTNLSPKNRASMYFYDYLNKMYYETEKAYNLLTNDTVGNYFSTLDEFKDYISKCNNSSMKEFSVEDNKIGIKDNYGNEYIFEISYILKYNVTIIKAEE